MAALSAVALTQTTGSSVQEQGWLNAGIQDIIGEIIKINKYVVQMSSIAARNYSNQRRWTCE